MLLMKDGDVKRETRNGPVTQAVILGVCTHARWTDTERSPERGYILIYSSTTHANTKQIQFWSLTDINDTKV